MASASARRYARALFELAQESGDSDRWSASVELVRALLTDPKVRGLVRNPTIPVEQRQSAVEAVAMPEMGPEAWNLTRLLIAANRTDVIDDVATEFERLTDQAAGRVRATATAAVELSAEEAKRLGDELAQRLGREVRLQVRVDPRVLGGLVLQYGDRLLDASLASRLQQLRRQLGAA